MKSPNDKRLYRLIKLDNGLTALLVHDPEIGEAQLSKDSKRTEEAEEEDEEEEDEDEDEDDEDDEDDEEDSEEDDEEEDEEDEDELKKKKKKGGDSQTKKVGFVILVENMQCPICIGVYCREPSCWNLMKSVLGFMKMHRVGEDWNFMAVGMKPSCMNLSITGLVVSTCRWHHHYVKFIELIWDHNA